jgi:hypothetical protein
MTMTTARAVSSFRRMCIGNHERLVAVGGRKLATDPENEEDEYQSVCHGHFPTDPHNSFFRKYQEMWRATRCYTESLSATLVRYMFCLLKNIFDMHYYATARYSINGYCMHISCIQPIVPRSSSTRA